MTVAHEIAPDLFRISTYVEPFDLQFNQFLVRDEEPLLFHTGLKKQFPTVRAAVAEVLDPAKLRWIAFSGPGGPAAVQLPGGHGQHQ